MQTDPNRTQLGSPVLDPNKTVMGSPTTLNATQTIKPVQCTVCKTFNPAGVMFCVECGLIFDRALPADAFGAPAVQLPVLVDENGREYPIRPGDNTVGREGDVMLVDPRCSRRHATIRLETDGAVQVEDLASTNGTFVNGAKLEPNQPKPLAAGDKVSFGGFEMQLSMPGKASATMIPNSNKTAAMATPPTVEAPAARLVGSIGTFPLRKGVNTFGRRAENDVAISDPYVSGRHGTIEIAEDGIYLTDVGSTNGTMLNDAKLSPNMRTKITEDDVIQLGSLELRVERDSASASATVEIDAL